LWMGTHESVPSINKSTNVKLADELKSHPELMSSAVAEAFNGKLPFLFKVLSIQKALSIQAHPDKELAKTIHAQDPKNYKGEHAFIC